MASSFYARAGALVKTSRRRTNPDSNAGSGPANEPPWYRSWRRRRFKSGRHWLITFPDRGHASGIHVSYAAVRIYKLRLTPWAGHDLVAIGCGGRLRHNLIPLAMIDRHWSLYGLNSGSSPRWRANKDCHTKDEDTSHIVPPTCPVVERMPCLP
jgi:hypothetical protein